MSDCDKKIKIKCQTEGCKGTTRRLIGSCAAVNGNSEPWDYGDVRDYKPEKLRSRDGKTVVQYDPTKHGHKKGAGR